MTLTGIHREIEQTSERRRRRRPAAARSRLRPDSRRDSRGGVHGANEIACVEDAVMVTRADLTRTQLSDGELIRLTGEGDSLAFGQLYHRFAGRIFGWAFQRLRDRGSAEEATQETFTAVWRSASSYRAERGPGGAWLFAVARNAIVG